MRSKQSRHKKVPGASWFKGVKIKKPKWLQQYSNHQIGFVATIAVFGVIGVSMQLLSSAATLFSDIQAEDGQLSGSLAMGSDLDGSYVIFGQSTTRLEAEAANHNVQVVDREYASGGKVLGYFGLQNDYLTVTMQAPETGEYTMRVRYAAADSTAHKLDPLPRSLIINGDNVRTVNFPRTSQSSGAWNTMATLDAGLVELDAGNNTITLRIDTATEGHWEVDYIEISRPGTPAPDPDPDPEPNPDPPGSFAEHKSNLLNRMTGFAKHAGTTGGNSASVPTVVTNTNDSGPGSLRDALSQGNRWITFDKTAFPPNQERVITLTSGIQLPSNITIDGRGSQVRVTGTSGFTLNIGRYDSTCNAPQSNIIIHNIKAGPALGGGQTGDIITINPRSDRIWIDHVEFITPVGDEALSLLSCTTQYDPNPKTPMRATFSFLKFDNFSCSFNPHNYPVLIGNGTLVPGSNPTMAAEHDGIWERQPNPDQPNKVSFHDSYLSNVCYRGPLIYDSRVHIWNNYVSGYTGTALDIVNVANVRYENSVIHKAGSSTSQPAIRVNRWNSSLNYLPAPRFTSVGSILLGGAVQTIGAIDGSPAFTPPYSYTITNTVNNDSGAALLNRLNSSNTSNTGRAGWVNMPGL